MHDIRQILKKVLLEGQAMGLCEVLMISLNFRPKRARYLDRRSVMLEEVFVLNETAKSLRAASAAESETRQTSMTCASWTRSKSS